MKNTLRIVIVFLTSIVIIFTFITATEIISRYGVIYNNNKPEYIDPSQLYFPVLLSKTIKSSHNAKTQKAIIIFNPEESEVEIFDVVNVKENKINLLNIEPTKTVILKYKIENNALFFSEEDDVWEKVIVEFKSDKIYYHFDYYVYYYLQLEICWEVKIKTKWVSGTYLIAKSNFYQDTVYGKTPKSAEGFWKSGVAYLNNQPIYFDPAKLKVKFMELTKDYEKKYEEAITIPSYRLDWRTGKKEDEKFVTVYGFDKTEGKYISNFKLYYKLLDGLYLSEDKENWEKLEITNFNDDNFYANIYWIRWNFHLKCKWFEGEYILSNLE